MQFILNMRFWHMQKKLNLYLKIYIFNLNTACIILDFNQFANILNGCHFESLGV